jgi:hypothetical protein
MFEGIFRIQDYKNTRFLLAKFEKRKILANIRFLHCPFSRHQCRRCPDPHRPRKGRCPEGAVVQHPLAKMLLLPTPGIHYLNRNIHRMSCMSCRD